MKEMPHSRFLMQNDRFDFEELIHASTLPFFATDVTLRESGSIKDRRIAPISDESVHVSYYLVCKKKDRSRFKNLLLSRMD